MIEGQSFRDAMAQFAVSVTIITSDGKAGESGVTASSVTSVCDAPPIVLVCLNRAGRASKAIHQNGIFCVNLLASNQAPLARVFAGSGSLPMKERFALGHWSKLASGAPVLDGCQAALDCQLTDDKCVGTHIVLFGRVLAVRHQASTPPLLYAQRDYRRLLRWDEELPD